MSHLNIEIKAKCSDGAKIEKLLLKAGAEFQGVDLQKDTYLNVNEGRMKVREGNIEHALVYYERPAQGGPKGSAVELEQLSDSSNLLNILKKVLGVKVVVEKERKIFWIDNIKFHIDQVDKLGSFVEIEAQGDEKQKSQLNEQCVHYVKYLGIKDEDLLSDSYSDMLLKLEN